MRDDYVTKPFSNKVLQRVKAILRRCRDRARGPTLPSTWASKLIACHQVNVGEKRLDLTPTEFRLLECMIRQPGGRSRGIN